MKARAPQIAKPGTIHKTQTTFMFFSRSADAPPGKGTGEADRTGDCNAYRELSGIPHWRRALSNFYAPDGRAPENSDRPDSHLFILDKKKWRSVEHYFHAQKFINSDPDLYESFALDSGSALSRATGPAVKKAGRSHRMTREEAAAWEAGGSRAALKAARAAKFRQNDYLARILVLTAGAQLTHSVGRSGGTIVETDLMELRDELVLEGETYASDPMRYAGLPRVPMPFHV